MVFGEDIARPRLDIAIDHLISEEESGPCARSASDTPQAISPIDRVIDRARRRFSETGAKLTDVCGRLRSGDTGEGRGAVSREGRGVSSHSILNAVYANGLGASLPGHSQGWPGALGSPEEAPTRHSVDFGIGRVHYAQQADHDGPLSAVSAYGERTLQAMSPSAERAPRKGRSNSIQGLFGQQEEHPSTAAGGAASGKFQVRTGHRHHGTAISKMRRKLQSGFVDVEMMPEPRLGQTASESVREEPWPERQEESFQRGRALLETFDLNPFDFSADDLCHLALELLITIGADAEDLGMGLEKLKAFVLAVRSGMHANPYHNWFHAFDVTQTSYAMSLKTGVMATLSATDRFAFMAAALCHDLDHPGVSSQFLALAGEHFTGDFRDPVLEKHHTLRAFQVMVDEHLLDKLSTVRYYEFRNIVSRCILATEISRHKDYIATLHEHLFLRADAIRLGQPEPTLDKILVFELLIKSADISNVIKDFTIARSWGLRVMEEFFVQGDLEQQYGLQVTPVCNRLSQDRCAAQQGFIDFVCAPWFETLVKIYPSLLPQLGQMKANQTRWGTYDDARMLAEEEAATGLRSGSQEEDSAAGAAPALQYGGSAPPLRPSSTSSEGVAWGHIVLPSGRHYNAARDPAAEIAHAAAWEMDEREDLHIIPTLADLRGDADFCRLGSASVAGAQGPLLWWSGGASAAGSGGASAAGSGWASAVGSAEAPGAGSDPTAPDPALPP